MYIVFSTFSGSSKKVVGSADNLNQVTSSFQSLKKEFESKYSEVFDTYFEKDSYILSGCDHDGYHLSFIAEPIKNIREVLK